MEEALDLSSDSILNNKYIAGKFQISHEISRKNFARKSAILEQSPCASNFLCFVLVISYLKLYLVTQCVFTGRASLGYEKLFYGSSMGGKKVGKQ